MRRTVGDGAAIIAALLLATDTSFLLTTCFDWGPVALQHLLMVGGILLLVCFYQSGKLRLLGLGFLLFGLGMWDKAVFSWTLGALTLATLFVFPRELKKELRWRQLLIAGFCFVIGAFPLLWYNIEQGGRTFSSNAKFSQKDFAAKWETLRDTANGSALFGYLVADDHPQFSRPEQSLAQHASVALSHLVGGRRSSFSLYSFLAALIALPVLWRTPVRKLMLFSLIFLAVAWLQMAFTIGAGTGAHHVILMWPWPMFFVAGAFSNLAVKMPRYGASAIAAAVLFLCTTNLLVTNQYLEQLIHNGPGPVWTDAIFPLAGYLHTQKAGAIYSVDWGTTNSLRLIERGSLPLQEATFTLLKDSPSQQDIEFLRNMIQRRDALLLAHTGPFEAFKGINERLNVFAIAEGYQPHIVNTIHDGEGRAVFEILRFEKKRPDLPLR